MGCWRLCTEAFLEKLDEEEEESMRVQMDGESVGFMKHVRV